jgi:hypothetical protein
MTTNPCRPNLLSRSRISVFLTKGLVALAVAQADATPQFARKYQKDCSFCHLAPPILNARGEAFVARGYRLDDPMTPIPSHRTVPLAIGARPTMSIGATRPQIGRSRVGSS